MPDSEEYRCEKCGRTFDTHRGLKVHESQAHKDEEDTIETDGRINFSVSTSQALVLTFFMGIAVGFMFAAVLGLPSTQSDSGVVELSSTEYPFAGINAGTGTETVTYGNKTFDLSDEPFIGNPSAEVTIVAYEDFECPFCKRYNEDAFRSIVSQNVQSGEVKYYFKNFPLSQIHPWATKAGIASECALNQDEKVFWVFKEGFYSNQKSLTNAYKKNPGLFDKSMKRWAEQTGLDTEQFNQCYTNQEELAEVREDQQEGINNGVSGTPTFFVNGQKLVGAQPYSAFSSAIEQAR